jgi:A/G-specific adenine glycosylase
MDNEARFRESLKETGISRSTVRLFRKIICSHYQDHVREMPWRSTTDPYRILVSEIMLQQTQVERALQKYEGFIQAFPDFPTLSQAPLSEVLRVWQGMGYNRRALLLRRLAEIVVQEYAGRLPDNPEELVKLPGIGPYSASAVYTFAHNRPSLFIETNIRRVYIHFFFDGREHVRDNEIIPVIEKTLDRKNPRDWYYALMDYGVKLKKEVKNPNRRSAHYQKQSAFHGSTRQVRGMILRTLLKTPGMTKDGLKKNVPAAPEIIDRILKVLLKEDLIMRTGRRYFIP